MQPWQLIFADLVTFDFRVRGAKAKMLLIYDLVTDGIRCISMKRKADIGEQWNKLVVQESLNKREHKVTSMMCFEHIKQNWIHFCPLSFVR